MATHFNRSALPPARAFYEQELGKLSRPSRGWSRGRCPFHQSKSGLSFSVNLDTGGFYCFGCDAKGGDVVAFLMRRDGVDFKHACQDLGVWDGAITVPVEQLKKERLEREQRLETERRRVEDQRRARIDACDRLHRLEKVYRLANRRLTELRKKDQTLCSEETDTLMDFMSDCLWEIREAAATYSHLAGVGDGD
jgi:DNA primase